MHRELFVGKCPNAHPLEVLGIPFRFVTVVEAKFLGVVKRMLDGKPIYVTDRGKTLLDAADCPDLSGGIGQLGEAERRPETALRPPRG